MLHYYLTMLHYYLTMLHYYLTMLHYYLTMLHYYLTMLHYYLTMLHCYITMLHYYLTIAVVTSVWCLSYTDASVNGSSRGIPLPRPRVSSIDKRGNGHTTPTGDLLISSRVIVVFSCPRTYKFSSYSNLYTADR